MANNLNMGVIAEGVDNISQIDILRKNGCNEAQGVLFSKPLSNTDFELILTRDRINPIVKAANIPKKQAS